MRFPAVSPIIYTVILNSLIDDIHAFSHLSPLRSLLSNYHKIKPQNSSSSSLSSSFFDASLYDDDDDTLNPFTSTLNPLAAPPNTKLVLGINKYSHDTTVVAANAETGQVLFALSKERLSRKKYDGGNVATLVETCLDNLDLDLDAIDKVVVNNHHHRVLPIEDDFDQLEWEEGMNINGGTEMGYTDDENLLIDAEKIEISHHLAHAYSVAAQCPFDSGLIVIMDGMGETYRTMRAAIESNDQRYFSDLAFEGEFQCIPSNIKKKSQTSIFDWREGESVYEYKKSSEGIYVKPIFKRFVEEKTPPVLYNHGFDRMDSAGAVYSRASSHIFGDWNACGKVMGLAPWMEHVWDDPKGEGDDIAAEVIQHPILKGKLYKEGKDSFQIDRSYMMGTPYHSRNDPDLFDEEGVMIRKRRYDFDDNETIISNQNKDKKDIDDDEDNNVLKETQLPTQVALEAISLASRIQIDLESVLIDFVKYFKDTTNHENLCLAGGVALNSVLNGRLSRELGFKKVFIPPYPGDDGIAFGCCAYGLYGNLATKSEQTSTKIPSFWSQPLSPYLGPYYSTAQIQAAIEAASPWLDVEMVSDDQTRIDLMVREIESGGVIAWYQGRSELGPRALGHRSILADPRKKGLVRFINEIVKKRESFRPFAPSVLSEEASKWFDLGEDLDDVSNISPYMSMTAFVKESKRGIIPAVTHVDGSSRLQTVTKENEPLYHQFISSFFKKTGVPMVLNTSFNTLPGEPIVETPSDAIRSFLGSMGSLEMLVMEEFVIKRKDADVRRLLGETTKNGVSKPPACPKRAGPVDYETKFSVGSDGSKSTIETTTRVRMRDRPMHNENDGGWFELLDDLEGEILGICNGDVGVNEIMSQYLQSALEDDDDDKTSEYQEIFVNNLLRRLTRLYEYTFISW